MQIYIHKNSRSQIEISNNEAKIIDLHSGQSRKQFVKVDGQGRQYVTRFGKKIRINDCLLVKSGDIKSQFEILKKVKGEISNFQLSELCDSLAKEIVSTSSNLISVDKIPCGRGTWETRGFVNGFHFGNELSKIVKRGLYTITHDEDKVFEIKDFEDQISEIIYDYIQVNDFEDF